MKSISIKRLRQIPNYRLTEEGKEIRKTVLRFKRESITAGILSLGLAVGLVQLTDSTFISTNPQTAYEVLTCGSLLLFFMTLRFAGKGRKANLGLKKFNKKSEEYIRK